MEDQGGRLRGGAPLSPPEDKTTRSPPLLPKEGAMPTPRTLVSGYEASKQEVDQNPDNATNGTFAR